MFCRRLGFLTRAHITYRRTYAYRASEESDNSAFFPVDFNNLADVVCYLPERIEIATDHVGDKSIAVNLYESRITLLGITYSHIEAFIGIRLEREVTAIVVIDEILFIFVRIFFIPNILTRHGLTIRIKNIQKISVCSDTLLYLPELLNLGTCYYLVEVHLLDGQI